MNKFIIGIVIFFSFFCFTFSAISKEEVYYCIEEDSNGFIYRNDSWERTGFKVKRFKALIDLEESTFKSSDLVIDDDLHCTPSYNHLILSCMDEIGNIFIINKKNLRFVTSHSYGYITQRESEEIVDSVSLSYGKCELF